MLLGTSLIFCISDVLDGTVDYNDIFAIVSSNQFNIGSTIEITDWYRISLHQYNINQNPSNKLHEFTEKEVVELFRELVHKGVIISRTYARSHNPSVLGLRNDQHWFNLCLMPDNMEAPVKDAWDMFKTLENICKRS